MNQSIDQKNDFDQNSHQQSYTSDLDNESGTKGGQDWTTDEDERAK